MTEKPKYGNCLKFRTAPLDLIKIEEQLTFHIPPIYRSFISNFEQLIGEIIKDPETNELKTLSYYAYFKQDGEDIMFQDFMEIEDSITNRENVDVWIENKLMPIGEHDHGGCLLIGISPTNLDEIYYENDKGLELIEPDIFSFIKNLVFINSTEFENVSA